VPGVEFYYKFRYEVYGSGPCLCRVCIAVLPMYLFFMYLSIIRVIFMLCQSLFNVCHFSLQLCCFVSYHHFRTFIFSIHTMSGIIWCVVYYSVVIWWGFGGWVAWVGALPGRVFVSGLTHVSPPVSEMIGVCRSPVDRPPCAGKRL